jgi:hypothetical protein
VRPGFIALDAKKAQSADLPQVVTLLREQEE